AVSRLVAAIRPRFCSGRKERVEAPERRWMMWISSSSAGRKSSFDRVHRRGFRTLQKVEEDETFAQGVDADVDTSATAGAPWPPRHRVTPFLSSILRRLSTLHPSAMNPEQDLERRRPVSRETGPPLGCCCRW